MGSVRIRPIEDRDAATATRLCAELGYPVEESAVLARVGQIAGDPNRAVLVACVDDAVLHEQAQSIAKRLAADGANVAVTYTKGADAAAALSKGSWRGPRTSPSSSCSG